MSSNRQMVSKGHEGELDWQEASPCAKDGIKAKRVHGSGVRRKLLDWNVEGAKHPARVYDGRKGRMKLEGKGGSGRRMPH